MKIFIHNFLFKALSLLLLCFFYFLLDMAAESNLQLSAADKELCIKDIEKEFPRNPRPEQIVPDEFIDYCDDVSFLELYDDWKSIPYYELWYERACMTFLLPQGLLYILPVILHTMVKRAASLHSLHDSSHE